MGGPPKKGEKPQNGWFIMENPYWNGWFGGVLHPYFWRATHMWHFTETHSITNPSNNKSFDMTWHQALSVPTLQSLGVCSRRFVNSASSNHMIHGQKTLQIPCFFRFQTTYSWQKSDTLNTLHPLPHSTDLDRGHHVPWHKQTSWATGITWNDHVMSIQKKTLTQNISDFFPSKLIQS